MVKRNGGWTLIELLIVVAIVGAVALILPPIFTNTTRFFVMGKARLQLQEEARSAMYIVTRELRQAQSNTIVIDEIPNQPYYSRIKFQKAQGTSITVAQSGSSLVITEGITVSTMTQNLVYMAFSFPKSDDMTIVSVAMTLQEKIYGGAYKALHMASEKVRVMN